MLKKTGTEKHRLFCNIFIIGGISIGGAEPPEPPLAVIVITFYSPSCLGQETAKGRFGLRVNDGYMATPMSERWARSTVPYGKSGPGYCITFIKR